MQVIIPDASIITAAVLKSNPKIKQKSSKFLTQVRKQEFFLEAPHFLKLEFANATRFYFKDYGLILKSLSLFAKLPIKFIELKPKTINEAAKISYKFKTSVYDAAYHALAIQRSVTFLTADKKYFNKTKELDNIKLIS
ncbi:MAG: type II toxin-antitoxin system VapC family toxin [Patescibacteria group bacterium]